MTNKELIEIANMELRDQLEAERVKVKKYKEQLEIYKRTIAYALDDLIYVDWNDKKTRDKKRMDNIEKLQKVVNEFKNEVLK